MPQMDGPTLVALVSIVAGAAVGLGAPLLNETFAARREQRRAEVERARQERQFDHERELRDSQELRLLLDEAAITLEAGYRAALDLVADFKLRPEANGMEGIIPAVQRLQNATDIVEQIAARLAIRLGVDHEAPRLVNDASLQYRAALTAVLGGLEEQTRDAPKAEAAIHSAQSASGEFLQLAKELVGSRQLKLT